MTITTTKKQNDGALEAIVSKWANDWFTISPKFRTKKRLAQQMGAVAQETADLCKEIIRREARNVRI
jgi:hypothetical protein